MEKDKKIILFKKKILQSLKKIYELTKVNHKYMHGFYRAKFLVLLSGIENFRHASPSRLRLEKKALKSS